MSFLYNVLGILAMILVSPFLPCRRFPRRSGKSSQAPAVRKETTGTESLDLRKNPGQYFTVIQIGLNAVANPAASRASRPSPLIFSCCSFLYGPASSRLLVISFSHVTGLSSVLRTLSEKERMTEPERIALAVAAPMTRLHVALRPAGLVLQRLADAILGSSAFPCQAGRHHVGRRLAMADAGTQRSLPEQGAALIANVLRTGHERGASASVADDIVFLPWAESEETFTPRYREPHGKYLSASGTPSNGLGVLDSKTPPPNREGKTRSPADRPPSSRKILPARYLSLFEALERPRRQGGHGRHCERICPGRRPADVQDSMSTVMAS